MVVPSPRAHYYYKESKNGEEYKILGSLNKKKLDRNRSKKLWRFK